MSVGSKVSPKEQQGGWEGALSRERSPKVPPVGRSFPQFDFNGIEIEPGGEEAHPAVP